MSGRITLAEWRKERGLSQRDMASLLTARMGRTIHQQNVGQWETGTMPGGDVAEAIREITGGRVTGRSFKRQPNQQINERN